MFWVLSFSLDNMSFCLSAPSFPPFLGSGPDRGRSPVEWGDFPFVRSFVRPFVRPPLWAIQPGLRPSQPGLRPSQPGLRPSQPGLRPSQPASQPASGFRDGWLGLRPGWLGLRPGWMAQRGERTDGWTNVRTVGKSPHSIGLSPLLGPLPKNSSGGKEQKDRERM